MAGSTPPARDQVLIHFYRAVVGHGDVWRQRMDATTNWAAATSAVMITFAFGSVASPHFVLMIALAFDLVFLLMESRRYQIYDLWRRRFTILNRHLIAPALLGERELETEDDTSAAEDAEGLRALANDLSHMVPHLGLVPALSYRVRRNYGYLFAVVLGAWVLKLEMHPAPAASVAEFIRRAAIGPLAGELVLGVVGLLTLVLAGLGLSGPSEQMRHWTALPSPIVRMRGSRGTSRADVKAAEHASRVVHPKLEASE
jgi:uncharacterized membrane protein